MEKELIEYKGHTIEIILDEDAESPDDWENEDKFLIFDHRQFSIQRKGYDPREIFSECWEKGECSYNNYWLFGVEAYIHSGVVLALKDEGDFPDRRWDVSFAGFILVQKGIKKWSVRRKQAEKAARSLIEAWNVYLSGEIYGYNIEETGDSCWGFYGKDYCIKEAKETIDRYKAKAPCPVEL